MLNDILTGLRSVAEGIPGLAAAGVITSRRDHAFFQGPLFLDATTSSHVDFRGALATRQERWLVVPSGRHSLMTGGGGRDTPSSPFGLQTRELARDEDRPCAGGHAPFNRALDEMMGGGLVTLEKARVIDYRSNEAGNDDPSKTP